uniref:Uncharacterized protein n=1 Tax=Arundo donax TaxID=35708 RepID=A0A0A9DDY9_ARUDO
MSKLSGISGKLNFWKPSLLPPTRVYLPDIWTQVSSHARKYINGRGDSGRKRTVEKRPPSAVVVPVFHDRPYCALESSGLYRLTRRPLPRHPLSFFDSGFSVSFFDSGGTQF